MEKIKRDQLKNLEDSKVCTELISLNVSLGKSDFERLALGKYPNTMDDKWFVYEDNNEIFFYRSWTGKCVAVLNCLQQESDLLLTDIRINPTVAPTLTPQQLVSDIFSFIRITFHIELAKAE